MKKISILFSLSIALASLTFCKKKEVSYTIEGHVQDNTYNQGMTGASVFVELKSANSSSAFEAFKSVTLNSSGDFTIEIPRGNYTQARFTVEKGGYFETRNTLQFQNLSVEETNKIDLSSTQKSWARIIFINDNGQTNDILSFLKQKGKTGCDECCNSETVVINGSVGDTIVCINDANTEFSFIYSINGGNPMTESLITAPGVTTDKIIHY